MGRIPPHAKCVFEGEIFEVYQWPQTLFDGSLATFEGIKRQSSAFVLAMDGEDVLFAHQEQPGMPAYNCLFGGRIEKGEDSLAAAQRELREESGMTSNNWQLLGDFYSSGKVEWCASLFVAKNCRVTHAPQLDKGERITVKRVSLDTFMTETLCQSNFHAQELKKMIFNAFNPDAAQTLRMRLLSQD